jgi:hypothetical protein
MVSKELIERYVALDDELVKLREEEPSNHLCEDEILDEMQELWTEMTQKDREEVCPALKETVKPCTR